MKSLPVSDDSCSAVFASHVLEHLSREDFERALDETFRILAPGGIFRVVVPDLQVYVERYLANLGDGHSLASDEFMRSTYLGTEERPKSVMAFLSVVLGNAAHLWMWDYRSLENRLSAHGFVDVRRAEFNDCADPRFREVEEEFRFKDAVAVEAHKPEQ